ncbi:MAG: GTP-binding protein, partial [Bacteroidota bacterium]
MNYPQKPLTILTGFLGAGKTTFLNHILKTNNETRYAIIENEFGEQGIDGELVVRPDETIVELNNGCLCCTLNDNLYDILNELFDRRADYDEIIIEATGVADPTGLAQPFVSHPLIKKHFPLQGIICLVDAEQIQDQLEETEEAKSQVAYSDVLLINKTDLVEPEDVDALQQSLAQLNPLARIVLGHKGAFPAIELSSPQKSPMEEIFQHTDDHHAAET